MRLMRLSSSLCGGFELGAREKELEEAQKNTESKAQIVAATANLFPRHNISPRSPSPFSVLAHKKLFKRLLDGLNRDEATTSTAQRRDHHINVPFFGNLHAHA